MIARLLGLKQGKGRKVNNLVKPRLAMHMDARMWNNALEGADHDDARRPDVCLDRMVTGDRAESTQSALVVTVSTNGSRSRTS